VAPVPAGWLPGEENVVLALADDVSLPLLALWAAGAPSPAVQRLREGMTEGLGR
jgi:hypothetical protein